MARRGSVIAGNSAIPSGVNRQTLPPGTPGPGYSNSLAGMPGNGQLVSPAGGWGSTYGSIGLPRSARDFTDGAFGPFAPILSVPVDEVDQNGIVPARREQYRVGWNLPTGTPGDEGLKLATFEQLRILADLYSVARACIQFLKSQIVSLEWDITPTPDAAKAMRNDKAAMKDFGERKGKAVKFFKRPDPDYFNWGSWISAVMEEILVYDALSIVVRNKWGANSKGFSGRGLLGSNLDSLELISGPTIRPLYNMHGATPRPPSVAYQQYLYGVPRVDLMTMITERDIEEARLNGNDLKQVYAGNQLMYLPMVPRRWTPYGFPPVERGLIPITTGLQKQGYQKDFFTEGTVPAVYISPGADLSPNQIRELQDALNGFAGDTAFHQKIIVLPMGSKVDPQRPTPLADQFDEIVMAQTCMAFGVQPMQIGISPKVSTTQSPGAANQMAKMSGQQQDRETLMPTLLYLTGIMEHILHGVCGQTDMQFVFSGMTEEEDEKTTTDLIVDQVGHGLLTLNEGRDKLGLQPFSLPDANEPGVFTPTGFLTLAQGSEMAAAQLKAAQNPTPSPGVDPNTGQPLPPKGPDGPEGPGGPSTPKTPKPAGSGGAAKKPAASAQSGHNAAAEAANDAASATGKAPTKDSDGSSAKASNKAAAVIQNNEVAQPQPVTAPTAPEPAPDTAQDVAQALVAAWIAKQLADTMLNFYKGTVGLLDAVTGAVATMETGYLRMLAHGAAAAARKFGVPSLGEDELRAFAMQRAEAQRPFITGMAAAVSSAERNGTDPESWLPARANLYGEGTSAAWQQGYTAAVRKSKPDVKIVWRLGEAEHCPLCIARDGQEFTFETLPGWPGDGGFGGPLCLGGPNCNCHLDLVEGDKVIDQAGNTQRPAAPGYYAQQLSDITARRQQMAAEREEFVSGLPNQVGTDGTSAQSRAMNRDELRRRLAALANQRIRSSGGYGGVSVEPQDIPASLIASLLPQYGAQPDVSALPVTTLMDAVESMFAGKFAEVDVTKGAFGALMTAAVMELMREAVTGPERLISSELDALARHILKGRSAGSWTPKNIDHAAVGALVDALKSGMTRAEAVREAVRASRRSVNSSGQVMEPETIEDPLPPPGDASGLGGPQLRPHDAQDIYYDLSDLRPHSAVRATKGAADPSDPNPVDAEHVYNFMLQRFPAKALKWVKDARWVGPVAVDPDRVDTDDQESWAASHQPERVKHFQKDAEKGKALKPGVVVQEPGDDKVVLIDGHHRFLGAKAAGKPYMAYVGFVDSDGGPWDETHSFQIHPGADTQNKGVVPGLTKRSGMISIDLPDGLIEPVPGGPTDHHITLAYLGSDVDDGLLDEVIRSVKHVAAGSVPFTVEVGGLGRFEPSGSSDGEPVHYARVATDELTTADPLSTLRAPFAKYHASEHQDFKPHVTLAYGGPAPEPRPWTPFTVDAISVHRGGETVARIPLGAAMMGKSAETAELSTVHRPLGTHGLWGDKMAQLPAYIQNIAHAMIRDGHDESEAIQLAIGAVKRWAEGGGKVTPEVRAAAAAAVAEWERLKAEHSKGDKAAVPDVVKVGPHGYIHGWIFVGVPGLGDAVRHPSHGKGVIEGHDDKHVTVRFQSGKTHTFDVHRDASEEGHFTERGKLEHPIKGDDVEHLTDKVWNDRKEALNLTDDQLEAVRVELLKRHEKIGAWGPESDRMDGVRSVVQGEISDRRSIKWDAQHYSLFPGSPERAERQSLEDVKRDTERRAREQGVDPDLIEGHRAVRVELARRELKDPSQWNAHDHLPIHGGTPEQQKKVEESASKLFADVPPEKGALLKHIAITDDNMKNDPRFSVENVEGLYYPGKNHMEINPRVLTKGSSSLKAEDEGWYSKSGHLTTLDRTLDHEFGHHLDYNLTPYERNRLFADLTGVIGKTEYVTMPAANQETFVKDNKAQIVSQIGTYAATNSRELVAELWAEYHGKKVNGTLDAEQFKTSQLIGRHLAGHDTPYNPEDY
jgi:2'-5' RNA ligase